MRSASCLPTSSTQARSSAGSAGERIYTSVVVHAGCMSPLPVFTPVTRWASQQRHLPINMHPDTALHSCRDSSPSPQLANIPDAPATVSRPLDHLEHLLVLRRFYRNCIRAEVYYRSTAPVYTPYTEAELAEQFVSDDDREEAVEARKDEAMRLLIDMQVIADQIKVRTWQAEAMLSLHHLAHARKRFKLVGL